MKIAFIGFGEAATAFVSNWSDVARASTGGFDLKTLSDTGISGRYAKYGIAEHSSSKDALTGAGTVFSLVTADQAQTAAKDAAKYIARNALFLDCNSCSPGAKRSNRDLIEAAGGRYVDVAVMAPVYPALNKVPLHLSGPHAGAAETVLLELAMNPTVLGGDVGYASSIKMIRSIMIKGMEALTAQCILAARRADVDDRILSSLEKSFPGFDWEERSGYNLERMMQHGLRRAAEMEEVAKTVTELGLPSDMIAATVEWQRTIGALGLSAPSENYKDLADILNSALGDV